MFRVHVPAGGEPAGQLASREAAMRRDAIGDDRAFLILRQTPQIVRVVDAMAEHFPLTRLAGLHDFGEVLIVAARLSETVQGIW